MNTHVKAIGELDQRLDTVHWLVALQVGDKGEDIGLPIKVDILFSSLRMPLENGK